MAKRKCRHKITIKEINSKENESEQNKEKSAGIVLFFILSIKQASKL
jgi:hypothetical protein